MGTRTWTFRDDQLRLYTVTFDHRNWTGWQSLTLNGHEILRERRRWATDADHPFAFDGHQGLVTLRGRGLRYEYGLAVDGQVVAPTGTMLVPPGQPVPETPESVRRELAREMDTQRRIQNGAAWFYWIAGTSLVNAVLFHAGATLGFPIGAMLGFVFEGIFAAFDAPVAGWIGHLAVAATFWFVARRARAGSVRAFVVGGIVYAADTLLIALLITDWLFLAFHALAMYGIANGWRAARQARPAVSPVPA